MRHGFLLLLIVAVFALASDDGCTSGSAGVVPGGSGSDAITLTLLNDWVQSDQVLGLDHYEEGVFEAIIGVDRNSMLVRAYNPATGVPTTDSLVLDTENTNCFGVTWRISGSAPEFLTDDWTDNVMYHTDDFGASWGTYSNPSGNQARGMDFDGVDYWTTNGSGGGIWRFQPGVGQENIPTPEVPTQPSGLAVFPYGGDLGIALSTYGTFSIFFYSWDGSALSYLGDAACPVTPTTNGSYGLTYNDTNGHLYWSYKDGSSVYHLTEMSFSITSLERSTWASIKSSF